MKLFDLMVQGNEILYKDGHFKELEVFVVTPNGTKPASKMILEENPTRIIIVPEGKMT